jgi:hypothetical protein
MMTIGQRRDLKALRIELEWAATALACATERAEALIAGVFVSRLLDGTLGYSASAKSWLASTTAMAACWRSKHAANDVSVARAARIA